MSTAIASDGTTRAGTTGTAGPDDRWSTSYRDPGSGLVITVTTPRADPGLWHDYLAAAWRSYRAHGVERALDLDAIADGRSTSLLFAAHAADGRIVGGMRSQGPYATAEQSHAFVEWAGDPGQPQVSAVITERLPDGVVESKAAWVDNDHPGRRDLVACLARAPLHASMLCGARWALGTSADHAMAMWTRTGAVVDTGLVPVGYPDDRYRTTLVWWDRWALPGTMDEGHRRAFGLEDAQLRERPATAVRP